MQNADHILEIPRLRLGNWEISQSTKHLRNFLHFKNKTTLRFSKEFGKFPRSPWIWKISHISRYFRNFPDSLVFGEFPRFPGIWGISQNPRYLRNSPDLPNSYWNLKVHGTDSVADIRGVIGVISPPLESWG